MSLEEFYEGFKEKIWKLPKTISLKTLKDLRRWLYQIPKKDRISSYFDDIDCMLFERIIFEYKIKIKNLEFTKKITISQSKKILKKITWKIYSKYWDK